MTRVGDPKNRPEIQKKTWNQDNNITSKGGEDKRPTQIQKANQSREKVQREIEQGATNASAYIDIGI
jgi:hypothetical protein